MIRIRPIPMLACLGLLAIISPCYGQQNSTTADPAALAPMARARAPRHLLRNGLDYLAYQDFERALTFFREAEQRQGELTQAEIKLLRQGIQRAQLGLREGPTNPPNSHGAQSRGRPGAIAARRHGESTKASGNAIQLTGASGTRLQRTGPAARNEAGIRPAGTGPQYAAPGAGDTDAPAPAVSVAQPGAAMPAAGTSGSSYRLPEWPSPTRSAAPQPVQPEPSTPADPQSLPNTAARGGDLPPLAVPTRTAEPAEDPGQTGAPEVLAPATLPDATPRPKQKTQKPTGVQGNETANTLPPLPEDRAQPSAAPEPLPVPVRNSEGEPAPVSRSSAFATPPGSEGDQAPAEPNASANGGAEAPNLGQANRPDPSDTQLPAAGTGPSGSNEVTATVPAPAEAGVQAGEATPRPEAPAEIPTPVADAPPAPDAHELASPEQAGQSPDHPIAVPDSPDPASTNSTGGETPSQDGPPGLIPKQRGRFKSSLPPGLQQEVDRIARLQDQGAARPGQPSTAVPPALAERPGELEQPTTRLELPRAPSPSEARPLRAIKVPDEFVALAPRDWSPNRKYWAAAATCHSPLYFQDAALERYGYSVEQHFGPVGRFLTYPLDDPRESRQRNQILQPLFSGGLFIAQIVALPYNAIVDPPWEAEYDLGYYRPGDRVPTDVYYLPPTGVGAPLRGMNY